MIRWEVHNVEPRVEGGGKRFEVIRDSAIIDRVVVR